MNHTIWPPNGHLAEWILAQFESGYAGHAVDVGASDGISINTTYHLEKVHRWTVLSVEANPDFQESLLKHRAWVECCACDAQQGEAKFWVHQENPESLSSLRPTARRDIYPENGVTWKIMTVPVTSVDALLAKWQFPKLDALCIDTEGTELDVLAGCDLARWQPRVVVIEDWTEGCSDGYLEQRGYRRVGRNVHNSLFVREA